MESSIRSVVRCLFLIRWRNRRQVAYSVHFQRYSPIVCFLFSERKCSIGIEKNYRDDLYPNVTYIFITHHRPEQTFWITIIFLWSAKGDSTADTFSILTVSKPLMTDHCVKAEKSLECASFFYCLSVNLGTDESFLFSSLEWIWLLVFFIRYDYKCRRKHDDRINKGKKILDEPPSIRPEPNQTERSSCMYK